MKQDVWREGNSVRLLRNGEEFFPRVFEAIANAQREVYVDTFIVFDDGVGRQLQRVLIDAARRGVHVELTFDGYGSANLPPAFVQAMIDAGVRVHVFDPRPQLLGYRTNIFRRLHRKLVVIDARLAFTGGLNYSDDHVRTFGPEAKEDYAVEVEGPVVADMHAVAIGALRRPDRWWQRRALPAPAPALRPVGNVRAQFVVRDNEHRRDAIERHYREVIAAARRDIIIANAYFFPGYRLLRELRNAARRGVRVQLILQGNPDMPMVKWVGLLLYDYLLRAGVRIYEYCERPLHAKVAVVDDEWATVGSSNLDPLSLSLNLEANLMVRDRAFTKVLRERLDMLIAHHCKEIDPATAPKRTLWRQMLSVIAFHVARRFPSWSGLIPGHNRPAFPVTVGPNASVQDVLQGKITADDAGNNKDPVKKAAA